MTESPVDHRSTGPAPRRPRCRPSRWSIDPVNRITFGELDSDTRAMAAAFLEGRGDEGHPRRADHAQRRPVGADRDRAHPYRRRAGPAEHPAGAARTRRTTAGRVRAVSGGRRGVPRAPLSRRADVANVDRDGSACAARVFGRPTSCRKPPSDDSHRRRRHAQRSPRPTPSSSCSRREAVGRRKASSTRTATRWAPSGPASRHGASTPTPGCTCRCRSSGWAASAAASCRHCWRARRWSPRRYRGPETTLRLLERERVTLFRGWPDQAEALARHSESVGADLSSLRPGSLEALLPADQRAAPGARAKLFGMTEAFGPYCGYPADTDMPAIGMGQLRQAVRRAPRSASSTPTPASRCRRGRSG